MHSIRQAEETDTEAVTTLHQVPRHDSNRAAFIQRSIAGRNCYVATADEVPIGYSVLEYSFYENGFISVLYVHPEYRRMGIGEKLIRHLETVCRTPKMFTSTNRSNAAIQALLATLSYATTG